MIVAGLGFFVGDAVGIGLRVVANAGHLPRHFHERLAGADAEFSVFQFRRHSRARADVAALEELSAKQPVDPITLVPAYLGVGDNDRALGALERTHAQHSISLTSIKVDPMYDPLRNDPRFTALLREMHLAQ